MKTKNPALKKCFKAAAISTVLFIAGNLSAHAQLAKSNATVSDTVTYILYNNELSFDAKRTLVFDDKHSVDSLINVLAANNAKNYRVIYQKEGKQAQVVDNKILKALDKTGIYRLTVAYNKPDEGDGGKPLYIIKSK